MNLQTKILLITAALLISFAAGRYSATSENKTETLHETEQKQTAESDHTQTIIVHTKQPDGAEKTVTTITREDDTVTKDIEKIDAQTKVTQPPKVHISALAGLDSTRGFIPVYGAEVSKQILGPVSIGAWGLSSGTFGVSIGVSF